MKKKDIVVDSTTVSSSEKNSDTLSNTIQTFTMYFATNITATYKNSSQNDRKRRFNFPFAFAQTFKKLNSNRLVQEIGYHWMFHPRHHSYLTVSVLQH